MNTIYLIHCFTSADWESEPVYRQSFTLSEIEAMDESAWFVIHDNMAHGEADQKDFDHYAIHQVSRFCLANNEGRWNGDYGTTVGTEDTPDGRVLTVWAVNAND